MFGSMGMGGPFRSRSSTNEDRRPSRGQNLKASLHLSFLEAIQGATKVLVLGGRSVPGSSFPLLQDLHLRRHSTCIPCAGSGVQPGTKPQRCSKCNGTGEMAIAQGPPILLNFFSNSIFYKYDFLFLPIGMFHMVMPCDKCGGAGSRSASCGACAGSGLKPESATVRVTIPAGVTHGTSLRVVGQGPCRRVAPPGAIHRS